MSRSLRVLVVDDSEDDCILEIETLKASGFDPAWKRVQSGDELIAAMEEEFDVIFSDHPVAGFDAKAALAIVRQKNSEIPFVIVSQTIGEETAADLMRCGANDVVLKNNLWRLAPVAGRELRDAEMRRERRKAEAALHENDRKYRLLVEQAFDAVVVVDRSGLLLEANRSARAMTGYSEDEFRALTVLDFLDAGDVRNVGLTFPNLKAGERSITRRTLIRRDGSRLSADISTTALDDGRVLLVLRDVSLQVETERLLRTRERNQRAIAQLGREIATGVNSSKLMDRAAHLISTTLEMEYCRIAECKANGTISEEFTRTVIVAGGPVACQPGSDNRHARSDDDELESGYVVGIGTPDRPLALIDVHSTSHRVVSEEDRAFLVSVSSLLGSAIERIRSEEALRRSERRFRRYFELGLVGMATTAPDGTCLDVNDRMCEMLGYERTELLRMTWPEFTHPEDLEADLAQFSAVLAGVSDGYSIDKRFLRKDGGVVYATISVACVRRADASIEHFISIAQDITERKAAQNALFRREEEFKALVDNVPDVISRFTPDFRHVYISPAIEGVTGIPASQFVGKTHREMGLDHHVSEAFEEALQKVFETGQEQITEFAFVGKRGAQVFEARIVPEFNASHQVEFALSITHDITAIRNSEARARESEAQLATAQRIANLGSWEMNLETGRRTWSREVFRIVGLPPAGEPPSEAYVLSRVHEEDRPAVIRAHEAAVESGQMQSVEHRFTMANGSERIFSLLIEPEKNAAGTVVKLTGTVTDVSVLRQAERSLRQSEQRMRDLVESANDAILTIDTTGKVLEVNPAVMRLMDESAEVIVGRHITHSIHPDYVAEVASGLSTVIEKGGVTHIEAPVRTGRGDYVHIEASASRQQREGADAIFVIGRDITERKRAEAERRALSTQIELLLESTYEGICSTDLEGICTLVNRAAAAMLGYTPAEMFGKNIHNLIHHRRADGSAYPVEDCPMTAAASSGKPVRVINEVFWRSDGTSFPVEIFVSPILDEQKTTVGIVASFIDVSERHFLQTELDRANRLTGLGRVAATMSHEFNNVLMGIQPFAEVLIRSSKDPKVLDAAKRISQSVQRGRRVTEELRGFTRPVEPVRRPVEVRTWLRDCATEIRRLLSPNIQFDIDVAGAPIAIEADREQMSQVISNLIINARDAIGGVEGWIRLGARVTTAGEKFAFGTLPGNQPFVHFSVADDGPGIAPENLARIIDPFFTTKKNGTGLGLAITQQIITLHRGHLFIESTVGVGTVVHFFLPATQREEVVAAAPKPAVRSHNYPSNILLIEDEESVASGLCALLDDEGIGVLVACDGADAMRLLATTKPQALVVDIGLPDCDGFRLYERITERFGPLPAVFSSGHADPVQIKAFGQESDVRILIKPYSVETLLKALEEVFVAAESRKQLA